MNYYSPNTGELIETSAPADWMGRTEITPPSFDRATQGCFFRDGAWSIVESSPQARTRDDVLNDLLALDQKSIRALREGNAERIAAIEAQAVALREELALIGD